MKRGGRVFVIGGLAMLVGAILWRVRGHGVSPPADQPEASSLVPLATPPAATGFGSRPSPDPGAKGGVAPHLPEPRDDGDEARIMSRIRDAVRPDPTEALALIDAANREHPHGPFVEERAALRIDALVYQRRIGPARDAAEEFLARYPQSRRTQHIVMLTGVHPPPLGPQDPSEDQK